MPEEAPTEEITDVVESPEGQTEEAPEETLDPKTLSFVVTEDGVDREVTLDELLKGNMRQADYTRKTQAAAQKVKEAEAALRIQDALRANPQATIAELARSFGVQVQEPDDEFVTPEALRIQELERRLEASEMAQRQIAVDREVNALVLKYGNDVDVAAVMQHAIQNNLPSLEASFKDLFFDDFHGVAKSVVTKKAKDELKVKAKKIASVVNNGGSAGGSTVEQVDVPVGQKLTLEQSFALAKEGKRVAPWHP